MMGCLTYQQCRGTLKQQTDGNATPYEALYYCNKMRKFNRGGIWGTGEHQTLQNCITKFKIQHYHLKKTLNKFTKTNGKYIAGPFKIFEKHILEAFVLLPHTKVTKKMNGHVMAHAVLCEQILLEYIENIPEILNKRVEKTCSLGKLLHSGMKYNVANASSL